jgi:translation initiation factor 4E
MRCEFVLFWWAHLRQLHGDWTFWFGKKRKQNKDKANETQEAPYEASLVELARVGSVEQFWDVFRWLKPVKALARDSSFFVFRGSAQPLWENWPAGGCIIVKLKKANELLDTLWQELVVCALGEGFMEPTVVGVAVSTRAKETYLSVWLSSPIIRVRMRLTDLLQRLLEVPATSLEYKKHTLSMEDKSTYRNAERLSKKSDRKSRKTASSRGPSKKADQHPAKAKEEEAK